MQDYVILLFKESCSESGNNFLCILINCQIILVEEGFSSQGKIIVLLNEGGLNCTVYTESIIFMFGPVVELFQF